MNLLEQQKKIMLAIIMTHLKTKAHQQEQVKTTINNKHEKPTIYIIHAPICKLSLCSEFK